MISAQKDLEIRLRAVLGISLTLAPRRCGIPAAHVPRVIFVSSSSSATMLLALSLLPLVLALPGQTTFRSPALALPPLNKASFVNHTLLPLNDGNFLPSPAFGVGTISKLIVSV